MALKYDAVSVNTNHSNTSLSISSISSHSRTKKIDPQDFGPDHTTEVNVESVDDEDDNAFDDLNKEERLEKAKKIMAEKDPVEIDMEIGEIKRLDETTLVERIESGFTLYHIQ
jgi:hypothetical protein